MKKHKPFDQQLSDETRTEVTGLELETDPTLVTRHVASGGGNAGETTRLYKESPPKKKNNLEGIVIVKKKSLLLTASGFSDSILEWLATRS